MYKSRTLLIQAQNYMKYSKFSFENANISHNKCEKCTLATSFLSKRFTDPYGRLRARFSLCPGDSQVIWESWQIHVHGSEPCIVY